MASKVRGRTTVFHRSRISCGRRVKETGEGRKSLHLIFIRNFQRMRGNPVFSSCPRLVKGHHFSFALFPFVQLCPFLLYLTSCPHNGVNCNPWFMTHSLRAHFHLDTFTNKHPMYPTFLELSNFGFRVPRFSIWSLKFLGWMFQLLLVDPALVKPTCQSGAWEFDFPVFRMDRMVTWGHTWRPLSLLAVGEREAASVFASSCYGDAFQLALPGFSRVWSPHCTGW